MKRLAAVLVELGWVDKKGAGKGTPAQKGTADAERSNPNEQVHAQG